MIEKLFEALRKVPAYRRLLDDLMAGIPLSGLGLSRATRLFILAALYEDVNVPFLFITDRSDRALKILEELQIWLQGDCCCIFPEPNPLFYENASWGERTRRDRLHVFTRLAAFHLPATYNNQDRLMVVAPVRALMTRTLPRKVDMHGPRTVRATPETCR